MIRDWSVVLYILVIISFGTYSTRATKEVVITANVGDPYELEFDVDTDANLEDSYFIKNGEKLQPGPNFQNGKLVFPQLTLLDAGKYHLIVNSKGNSKTHGPVTLKVVADLEEPHNVLVKGTLPSHNRITRAAGVNKRQTPHNFDLDVIECNESRRLYNCHTPTINKYRTIDGTCNNLRRPLLGASNTAFRRVLPAVYEDGVSRPIGSQQQIRGRYFESPWPSARYLSKQVVATEDEINSRTLTHMHMQWGQFLDHDIDLLGMYDVNCTEINNDIRFCFPIKVNHNDMDFGESSVNEGRDLPLTRSLPICPSNNKYDYNDYYPYNHQKRSGYAYGQSHDHSYHHPYGHSYHQSPRHTFPRSYGNSYYHQQTREHINRITHYIDASMVYGSNKETHEAMRMFSGGLMKTTGTGKGDLPYSTMKDSRGLLLFMAGDERVNEHTGLVVIQTLFHREHNRIARELSKINPCWGDEQLYQEARKIMGAIIQIITYEEYLPALYGEKWFDFYIGKFKHYSSYTSPAVPNFFAAALFRFGHSQIRSQFSRFDKLYRPLHLGALDLENGFFNPSEYYRSGYTDPILRGLLIDEAREVDEFISEGVASFLITSPESVTATDLTALNIQRGREHGLPSYRQWERLCIREFGNRPSFERPSTVAKFKKFYGDYGFRYGMDLWLAGLAEKHLDGSNIGPTFACLLAETFKALRDGDRFWWERPGVFTLSQRNTLSKVTLSRVICESSDGIESIQPNAFKLSRHLTRCSLLPKLDLSKWKDQKC